MTAKDKLEAIRKVLEQRKFDPQSVQGRTIPVALNGEVLGYYKTQSEAKQALSDLARHGKTSAIKEAAKAELAKGAA